MNVPPSPWGEKAMQEFLNGFFYRREAFLISEIVSSENGEIRARLDPGHTLLVAPYQTGDPRIHPRHVSGADFVMATACLGCLHAYFLHRLRWQENWVGFGSRMKNVHFRRLARMDRPVEYHSRELRARVREERALIEFAFTFTQDGEVVYQSEQSAMFVRHTGKTVGESESSHGAGTSRSTDPTGPSQHRLPR